MIINRRSGGTCPLHVQGRRNNASEERCWTVTNRLTTVPSRYFFYPVDGGDIFLRNISL
jgi:hypothetical protein